MNDDSLTVFESGHANYGWADYRDNHLGPEMREMKNTRYAFSDIKIHLAGKTACATFKYTISADVGEPGKMRHVDGGGLATALSLPDIATPMGTQGQFEVSIVLSPPSGVTLITARFQ